MTTTILQLERIPIYPPTNGRENRVWETAKALSSVGEVYIASPGKTNSPQEQENINFIGLNNRFLNSKRFSIHLWNAFQVFSYNNPYDKFQSSFTKRDLQRRDFDPNLIVVESPQVAVAGHQLAEFYDVPLLINKHNASYEILERFLSSSVLPSGIADRAVSNLKQFEENAIGYADAVVFQSEADREKFQTSSRIVETIPNGTDVSSIQQGGDPESVADVLNLQVDDDICVFVGSYDYIANQRAAEFIAERIAPEIPDIEFILAGRNPPEVTGSNVHTPGFVDDLPGLLHLSDIGLCPITIGSGTNLKILDYLAAGLPIVSSELATVGIDVENEKSVIIGESASEFVESIIKIQSNPTLQSELQENSRALSRFYDWDVLMSKYNSIVKKLLVSN